MKTSATGIQFIKHFESCSLTPYLCSAGHATIGWGNTIYPNGVKVTMRDKAITRQRADEIFLFILGLFERDVTSLVKSKISQAQFDALVAFAYNVGSDVDIDTTAEGLGDSTLLRIINANPADARIPAEFAKWVFAKGKRTPGLVRRRRAEAHLYTTGKLNLNPQ